ncbi:MAG TPA: hypothetical protein VMR16_00245 [Candidatus Saccharimonadales bacterium]|nr:hypothetical protein [Candidatus Saccharimonadales bacterium]
MKTALNKIVITAILTPALILLPVSPALAVTTLAPDPLLSASTKACQHLLLLRSTDRDTIATHLATMDSNFAARLTKITSEKAAVDQKVATSRANAKKQFEAKIQTLESKTGLTDAQKQAIATYKTDMELAETTRELAVDSARIEYRTALYSTIASQQTALSNAVLAYQAAFEAAFATAAPSCNDGTTISTLKTAVQTAHQTLKTTLSNIKTTDQIKQLATTRNNAIKAADNAFDGQTATYTTTLKSALGE